MENNNPVDEDETEPQVALMNETQPQNSNDTAISSVLTPSVMYSPTMEGIQLNYL